jgi:predicted Rossmann fold flavoprotein
LNAIHADAVVIGAGAAGMMCAAVAGQRGRRVVLVDHATRIGEKIRISGGGRCNFTNVHCGPDNFLSENPAFCRSALARYTAGHFIELVQRHRISWHEKHRGQLFCDDSAEEIVSMLKRECEAGAVRWLTGTRVGRVERDAAGFAAHTDDGTLRAPAVVIATGGLSIPKIGATDFGHRIAKQFGLPLVPTRPALVPLTFDGAAWAPYAELAGVSLEARLQCGAGAFLEDLLFTHRGLSGPAILQISSYWREGATVSIDLAPGTDAASALVAAKQSRRSGAAAVLGEMLPRRLAARFCETALPDQRPLADLSDRALRALGDRVNRWEVIPNGSEGYRKAEVTLGGVDTRALSSQSMEARDVPGLFFIGEVVDVTGHLGGHNFQWAWASGHAAGMAL